MLKLTEQQLAQLDAMERERYVDSVCEFAVQDFPELATDSNLRYRMGAAYQHCIALGFTQGKEITEFLNYEAIAPSFYRQPAISAWLSRPIDTPEGRWSDLMDVMKLKMRD